MREYFQLKHRDEYNEYCHFFKSLQQKHPNAKDLTKTSTYKSWKRRQLNCESSDEETEPTAEQIETEPAAEQIETEPAAEQIETEPVAEQIETEPAAEQIETEPVAEQIESESTDPLTAAMQETLPPYIENISIDQIDNIIQEVIHELQQDDVAQVIFNDAQDNDEGIDLDIETELEGIVEPFDYELEVEGIDY